jgi:SAM-dependent methyltransferase
MEGSATPACPLCHSDRARPWARAHGREYLECDTCRLIYLSPEQRLAPAAEKAHYETHENDPADPGYRAFLGRLAVPLVERLPPGAEGLDYGSGPGATLALMLEEHGFRVRNYDPFFAPDPGALRRSYDFITCTETVEHFFRPAAEFELLDRLLRPDGWLAVMTEVVSEERSFGEWRYARDPTHVCFYRRDTLEWIAARFGWSVEFPRANVAFYRQPRWGPLEPSSR